MIDKIAIMLIMLGSKMQNAYMHVLRILPFAVPCIILKDKW